MGFLTSLNAPELYASDGVREPISLHQAVFEVTPLILLRTPDAFLPEEAQSGNKVQNCNLTSRLTSDFLTEKKICNIVVWVVV